MAKRRREIRVALVLYGGVSLAVYMNGVVQELLRFVRARQGAAPDPGDPYERLLDLIGADPVLDVIAGSSAGGINGVLLAKALACGTDLAPVSALWRERADFAPLASHPRGDQPETLLNGAYFLRELTRTFAGLDQAEGRPEAQAKACAVPALDLFVTATDLRGRIWKDADSRGAPIWGREHAHYFHLRKRSRHCNGARGHDQNQFCGASDLLARISRATAAIPAVFAPQPFDRREIDPGHAGGLCERVWLYDGGLLDNRPFRKVLETISGRSAAGPVDRLLIYVEPDPEGIGAANQRADTPQPGAVDSLVDGIATATYQSIHQHVRDVQAHNRRVAEAARLRPMLNAIRTPINPKEPGAQVYLRLRLHHLADYLDAHVADGLRSRAEGRGGEVEAAGAALVAALRATPEADLEPLLAELDIPFYMRLLHHLIGQCDALYEEGEEEGAAEEAAWGLLEGLRHRLWQWTHPAEAGADPAQAQLWKAVIQEPHRAPDLIQPLRRSMRAWLAAADLQVAARAVRVAFGEEAQAHVASLAGIYAARDMLLLPLGQDGVGDRDRIELYRISPFDTPDGPPGAQKVAGEKLLHFGAFLDERWRANDLLWGRLDTADILVDLIRRKADGRSWSDETIRSIRLDLYRRILREEGETVSLSHLRAHLRQRFIARGITADPATDPLAHAQIEDLQSFLLEHHTVGPDGWRAPRLRPAVANAAVDLLRNALAVLRPSAAKIPFPPLRWLLAGLGPVVAVLGLWVRLLLPRRSAKAVPAVAKAGGRRWLSRVWQRFRRRGRQRAGRSGPDQVA